MKIQEGFVIQQIGEKTICVRTNDKNGFCGFVELNDTAAIIWKCIEKGYSPTQCAEMLTEKYDISYDEALKSVDKMCKKMIDAGILVEE